MNKIIDYFAESSRVIEGLKDQEENISLVVDSCVTSLKNGKKIIFCGNGGSAAEAQHFAAELTGKFLIEREPLASLALTVDTSSITAIGNDFGFKDIFSRQLKGIGAEGDILFGITTSGTSPNVISALKTAKDIGIETVLMTGNFPIKRNPHADYRLISNSRKTNYIQEGHLVMGHLICSLIEQNIYG